MLRVALAKGRLLESFIEYLQQVNQIDIATVLLNNKTVIAQSTTLK